MNKTQIDRTFYELLRGYVVGLGYIPNKRNFNNSSLYQGAIEAIRAGGKEPIEVYGVGPAEARTEKVFNRITINRKNVSGGGLGGFPATFFEPYKTSSGEDRFNKRFYPDKSNNIQYEIRIVAKTIKYERILTEIVMFALGNRKHIKSWNNISKTLSEREVFVQLNGEADLSGPNFIEKLFSYTAQDVWISNSELIRTNIKPLKDVNYFVSLPKEDGSSEEQIESNIKLNQNTGTVINELDELRKLVMSLDDLNVTLSEAEDDFNSI